MNIVVCDIKRETFVDTFPFSLGDSMARVGLTCCMWYGVLSFFLSVIFIHAHVCYAPDISGADMMVGSCLE